MLRRNPYRTPNKTPRKNYKQTKIVKFMKTEDEVFMENNVQNKIKEEVEFHRYIDKLKMKQLGMIKENGEYNYEAFLNWKKSKDEIKDQSMENK